MMIACRVSADVSVIDDSMPMCHSNAQDDDRMPNTQDDDSMPMCHSDSLEHTGWR